MDREKLTMAAQSADLLIQDLKRLIQSDNPYLAEFALELMKQGVQLKTSLDRLLHLQGASLADQVKAQCGGDGWGEFTEYPRSAWAHEVAENATSLGYFEWVGHSAESDEVDIDSLTRVETRHG